MNITSSEYRTLQKKYNKPKDSKQREKYQKYEKKIRDIMKKPPNDQNHIAIAINELLDFNAMGGEGYFYDPEEQVWCLYCVQPNERSDRISFFIYEKKETEEEAFQCIYESLEENVKRYEREKEREKNNQVTKKEFLEWYEQDNWKSKLADKGPYQIFWNRQPGEDRYVVGYYKEMYGEFTEKGPHYEWVAYVIVDGKYKMECPYSHEARAIYMMQYWIKLIIEGYFD